MQRCIQLYIGCETNKGKLVGLKRNSLLIESNVDESIIAYGIEHLGETLFLHLRQLRDLTVEESKELIRQGYNIGTQRVYFL